ncbi:hypothetical protein [Pedobacter lusitanus]|uniref:hypothetical protein n=1 Tax=Pedobacter lusitanus TaxID=1503925 RepID=UPI0026D6B937|nr:hypothetical protein [Pedobacter lusitanus]
MIKEIHDNYYNLTTMNAQELISFKQKALQWAAQFEVCCYFDSNGYTDPYSRYDFLLAAGARQELNTATGNAFKTLQTFSQENPGWLFGLLSYDLKNEIENLTSAKENKLDFPDLFFFVPQYLVAVKNGNIEVLAGLKICLTQLADCSCLRPLLPPHCILSLKWIGRLTCLK